jgi:hypothetical protein
MVLYTMEQQMLKKQKQQKMNKELLLKKLFGLM